MKRKEQIRRYVITSLAMSMLVVLWVLFIDAIFFGTGRIFKMIVSMMVFCFLICFIEEVLKRFLESCFWLWVITEFLMVAALFFIFGSQFHWYHKGQEWVFLIYAIPVYAAGYFLRLVGISKDARDINARLERRKKHQRL